jgi:parallel beta-helix repeat protein
VVVGCVLVVAGGSAYAALAAAMDGGGSDPACRGVEVEPGAALQPLVDARPPGTTFCLQAGTYREQQVVPKSGNRFIGADGVVLSGARLLVGFRPEGGRWVLDGQTQEGQVAGFCDPEHPRCSRPEDLFVDDRLLRHVDTLELVGEGRWFFDYERDTVHLGEDPGSRRVEMSVARAAFNGNADDVELADLTVEKYASPAQHGAIHPGQQTGSTAKRWLIRGVTARWNHGAGLAFPEHEAIRVVDSRFLANGQIGMGGTGSGNTIEGNEIAFNNTVGFEAGWEAGGTKFAFTRGLVVRDNHVHDNVGPGLWTDIDNLDTLYEGNTVVDNADSGIFHEISYRATIRDNVVRGNGKRAAGLWCFGAGIQIAASSDVEVVGNTVVDNQHSVMAIQQDRGAGALGPRVVRNLFVHDNRIEGGAAEGSATGACQDFASGVFDPAANNRFEGNRYFGPANAWAWADRRIASFAEWQSFGHDRTGSFQPDAHVAAEGDDQGEGSATTS